MWERDTPGVYEIYQIIFDTAAGNREALLH